MDYIEASQAPDLPIFAQDAINLADERLGARIVTVTDDFFAPATRMLSPQMPRFYPGRYDDHGKWMDGWESRRKRVEGFDQCVVALAMPGQIQGVEIDTRFFTGNYPPAASLQACRCPDSEPTEHDEWIDILETVTLGPDQQFFFNVDVPGNWTHVRLNIFPDGGVARLRVYGKAQRPEPTANGVVNLAALEYGARVVACNNSHFGSPKQMLMPGAGLNMGDGWETRRRREPGYDWCVIELATPGEIDQIIVDTAFFKGNFPDRCSIQCAYLTEATDQSLITQSMFWKTILPETHLSADTAHCFDDELAPSGVVTHVRLNIHPDGGISRFRVLGRTPGRGA